MFYLHRLLLFLVNGCSLQVRRRTLRRNSLSPIRMEQLQKLKYIFCNDRLNFTEDLACTATELWVADISPEDMDFLMANGRAEELALMIESSVASASTST